MLNRHAIVLCLGYAALLLLSGAPELTGAHIGRFGLFQLAVVSLLGGLFLDDGQRGRRAGLAHLLQGLGVALALAEAATVAVRLPGLWQLPLAQAGIALAVLGLLLEMRLPYRALRVGVTTQLLGDLLFVGALVGAFFVRGRHPSVIGWVFIAIFGLLGAYAALSNAVLQAARLLNPQAGWRYRVLGLDAAGLRLKTPDGECTVPWALVEKVQASDPRHLLLVLPSPLPPELAQAGLPLQELRSQPEPIPDDTPPDRYALVLHEQELGRAVPQQDPLRALRPLS